MSVINTNITSMIGQSNLSKSQSSLATSMERLSSGLRINSAKDDAAGQAIANRMSSQITGLAQAQRNANDGISVAQTAEGALNQVNDNLQRIRELAVQAENGTNSQNDLDSIQNEINQRLSEIDRISDETNFNGTKVLQSDNNLKIQVGANDGEAISISLKEINVKTLRLEGFNVDGSGKVANEAATAGSLKLNDFVKGAVKDNGSVEWSKTEEIQNTATTATSLLGFADQGSTVTYSGTNNGTGVEATGDEYTFNADTNSFSFDAADVSKADTVSYMTKGMEVGDLRSATVTVESTAQEIKYDRDGNIFAANGTTQLFLDSTGNLTQNNAGNPPPATLEGLAISMSTGAGTSTSPVTSTLVQGVTGASPATNELTFVDLAEGDSITVEGRTLTATGAMTADQVGAAFTSQFHSGSDASVGTAGADGSYSMTGTVTSSADGTNWTVADNGSGVVTFTATNNDDNKVAFTASTTTLGNATGGSISANGTTFTADTGSEGFDITGATISAAGMIGNLNTASGAVDIGDGVTYAVATGGAVTADGVSSYVDAAGNGLVTNASSEVTTTYFAHENGKVTDDTGAQVFVDTDSKLTMNSHTESQRTENALGVLDSALSDVDALRSDLGAIQNRFESAITNLSTTETNLSAARSRIEDADYAVEVANMTRAQILQQAGTSVLAQANQIPQSVLSLLG